MLVKAIMSAYGPDLLILLTWAEATETRRSSSTIAIISVLIGLIESEIDHLLRQASKI
jgi:hypothetical protein